MTTYENIAEIINSRPYMMQATDRPVTAAQVEAAVTDYDGLCVTAEEQDAWIAAVDDLTIALWAECAIIDLRQLAAQERE